MDSAFGCVDSKFLVQSSQDNLVSSDVTPEEIRTDIHTKLDATSMRHSAEWGMHRVQATFPRLKDTFKYEEGEEKRIVLKMMVLLNNL